MSSSAPLDVVNVSIIVSMLDASKQCLSSTIVIDALISQSLAISLNMPPWASIFNTAIKNSKNKSLETYKWYNLTYVKNEKWKTSVQHVIFTCVNDLTIRLQRAISLNYKERFQKVRAMAIISFLDFSSVAILFFFLLNFFDGFLQSVYRKPLLLVCFILD